MTPAELRERVARAIAEHCNCAMDCTGHLVDADAAIAVVLDEVAGMAKVAWLTYPLCNIADADAMGGMCEDLSEDIRGLRYQEHERTTDDKR